jgi:hypothetical protein
MPEIDERTIAATIIPVLMIPPRYSFLSFSQFQHAKISRRGAARRFILYYENGKAVELLEF